MLLALSVPAGNERGPLYMDQALAAIHQGNHRRLPLRLAFGRHGEAVSLLCTFPDELRPLVEGQLYAAYPDCRIERLPEDVLVPPAGQRCWTAELRLAPDLFPIRRYAQFEDALNRTTADPLAAILTALARGRSDPVGTRIEVTIRPAAHRHRARAEHCLRRLASPFFRTHHRLAGLYVRAALSRWAFLRCTAWLLGRLATVREAHLHDDRLHTSASRLHEREEDLQAAADKLGRLLFEAHVSLIAWAPNNAADRARDRLREMAGAFGQFNNRPAGFRLVGTRCGQDARPRPRSAPFLLSTEELATLFHLPTVTVRAPAMAVVESRELEPPRALPTPARHPGLAVLGVTAFRSRRQAFGILPEDRRRHLAVLGKTGMGKSTLLARLLASDIRAGRGVGLIDPHGDLTEAVLRSVPRGRTNDVVLFDAGDAAHPVGFNVLDCRDPGNRPLVASGVIAAFKKLYGDSWGPRLEHILRNALLTLLEVPGSTLVLLLRLLGDAAYRRTVVASLADPVVRAFWEHEFAGMPPRLQAEAVAPVQNKVGSFVSSPLLRNIVGQARPALDLRQVMDEGKVLLVNLSKGRTGDDASSLLGSLLVTGLQLAAMGRAQIPESDRRDFFLHVDEFQNFATGSFATILSEARKYRLSLTLANQYLAQVEEQTLAAVFGNVGTLVVFQVGAQDAEILAEQLGGEVCKQDLLAMPRFQACVRLLIDGMPGRAFSMRTLPPGGGGDDAGRADRIRQVSRRRYGRPAAVVEEQVRETFGDA